MLASVTTLLEAIGRGALQVNTESALGLKWSTFGAPG